MPEEEVGSRRTQEAGKESRRWTVWFDPLWPEVPKEGWPG